ncbi:hypothetical protein E5676_scaffold859G001090 [Cucumis melo var. makuwa]|uniref:Uncharacterized protein n=1 Tax=Cucumis melo var. makuwa TaxID=1194695 RepID=A0A5A7T9K4_CUCMM|nr:hypothetical protein E6C27_scaffold366G00870 [Cucumis melo var. makuwa]TYK21737.1 hypothetical protein E5676_scaffold859G001090 [Cucumis melo var. makuwa]
MVLISYFLYTENPACESVATATDLGTKFGKENEARASIRGRANLIVLSVAHLSADVSQSIARFPDPLTSHQLLYLLFAFPLQQLSRLALSLWTFFCVPPPGSFYYYYYSSDSDLSSYAYASD